ncbi:SDR family oxidoreductase [Rhodococcus oxybenzonivorans]|uniref:SDR family NAD(P)-dependent oxidoreductase n=1 Tax=Rhodococcus oxybenzonivorans TaxID=1990687 RepID=UPI0029530A19|nr:SDR family oxidoreductase [Rhodococcus oxybenzonivorans]MDV7352712.1 SDR family oxidoreductase [Rhodococcus oxybenzonivorans]
MTGGASGMGESLVRAFPSLGAKVVALDFQSERGLAVAEDSGAGFVKCDVSDEVSVSDSVDAATDLLGGLDVLVHAAGIAPGSPAESTPLEMWAKTLEVNATGTFLTNKAAFTHLKDNGGRILNFASAAGVRGLENKAAYSASKGAVVAWTRTVAQEWARYNITVNAIAPAIWTPMYDATRTPMTPEQLTAHDAHMSTAVPLGGRLGDAEKDFVPVLVFLSGPGARFMTGQVFPIDGGTLMMR